jgi:hypothetical protein
VGGRNKMRNIIRCDICNKEVIADKRISDTGFTLIDGLDFCSSCKLEYSKRKREMINKLQKERFGKNEVMK